VVDHLATEGYRPEYGARELRRQIRQQIENELAKEMLKSDIGEGSHVLCSYDAAEHRVVFRTTSVDAAHRPERIGNVVPLETVTHPPSEQPEV
jgi:ATP-dependent Clp protease ATP-binding subunit ClpC